MSRAKKRRAKERRAAVSSAAVPRPARGEQRLEPESRLAPARRRAAAAKTALVSGGAVVFGLAMLFARVSYAGHPKRPVRSLAAPPRFVSIVRANLLQAGIVAPAQAPPDAATSVS